jgi:hypothetical protein
MASAVRNRREREKQLDSAIDPRIRPLLDHVASELAREYIRLMEAAAAAEDDATVNLGTEGEQR